MPIGGMDEQVSWIIAYNTATNITTGLPSSAGYVVNLLSNAVIVPDY